MTPLFVLQFKLHPRHMSMNTLPTELLVRGLVQMEPEELSRCDQLSKLFHAPPPSPPSLVEQALRLLDNEGGLSGIPATLPNNHANWNQALVFLAILRRGSEYPRVAAGFRQSAFVDADGTLLICGKPSSSLASFGVWRSEQPEHSNASRMSRRRACAVGRCSPPPHHRPLCQWQSLQLGSWLSRLSRPTRAR